MKSAIVSVLVYLSTFLCLVTDRQLDYNLNLSSHVCPLSKETGGEYKCHFRFYTMKNTKQSAFSHSVHTASADKRIV